MTDLVETRVRYGETDRMGAVYHAHYLVYFELGRTEFMRRRGLAYSDLEREGVFLVVTEAECRYRERVTYDDLLSIETLCGEVGRVRVRFDYTVRRPSTGRLVAEGRTVLACVDASGRPKALPERARECLRNRG
ncbi:MAG: acyl-CoA thioesterase [Planctomycetes bacterium]|nr:acyl-CoA thioesterase [Planctomycetota bacterium]